MKTKGLFNLKISREVRDEFRAAAELRGATMSSVIHQFIFRYIREVKTEMPDEFEAKLTEVLARKPTPITEESVVMGSAPEEKEEALTAVSLLHAKPASPRRERYEATAYIEPEKKRGKK